MKKTYKWVSRVSASRLGPNSAMRLPRRLLYALKRGNVGSCSMHLSAKKSETQAIIAPGKTYARCRDSCCLGHICRNGESRKAKRRKTAPGCTLNAEQPNGSPEHTVKSATPQTLWARARSCSKHRLGLCTYPGILPRRKPSVCGRQRALTNGRGA